ncbi:peptide chain release factor N(5)-glutamine methyltransferase [Marinicrinis sediminis]|uniref:Release factor glutamine methyltransferase n=1 Tax=Marinicrinis sediminis TaxID=1652465 RepID=A0ABW5RAK1_9BACL
MKQNLTIREAHLEASSFLMESMSTQDASHVSRLLLEHVLGWDRSQLLLHWQERFPADKWACWQEALSRKAAGEPVQYIMGEQEFYGRVFQVNPSVLIPRPETELLVEAVLLRGRQLQARLQREALRVVDIGTGSGIIPVTLKLEQPSWQIGAVDLSPAALKVAQDNADRYAIRDDIRWMEGDLLTPLIDEQAEVDMVVSNPPYIPSLDIPDLQLEVRGHEPMLALDGGDDGLTCYRKLLMQVQQLRHAPLMLAFEVGYGQAGQVGEWMTAIGYEEIETIRDLAGVDRHVIGLRTV